MFRTEHLEGRLLYETNDVVCINVFINSNHIRGESPYLFQVLVSLKTNSYSYFGGSFSYGTLSLSKENVDKELREGISQYFRIRKELGLKC